MWGCARGVLPIAIAYAPTPWLAIAAIARSPAEALSVTVPEETTVLTRRSSRAAPSGRKMGISPAGNCGVAVTRASYHLLPTRTWKVRPVPSSDSNSSSRARSTFSTPSGRTPSGFGSITPRAASTRSLPFAEAAAEATPSAWPLRR
ncbi:hypothetical protein GCM10018963_65000 [Saccharothrix longispora]